MNFVEQDQQVLKVIAELSCFDSEQTQKIAAGMDGRNVTYVNRRSGAILSVVYS